MKKHMVITLAAMLTALPTTALANKSCNVESVEHITLDAADVSALKVSISPDKIQLEGREQNSGELHIRKCASSDSRLNALQVKQISRGDTLTLELDHGGQVNHISSFLGFVRSESYGYFEISGTIPSHWALDLAVGSGDAQISDIASVNIVIGSGDASVKNVAGQVSATVGSGNLELEKAGSLAIGSIGSGNLKAKYISSSADIGSIGSGDAGLDNIGDDVTVGNIGSGTFDVKRVAGNISVGTLGSGHIHANRIEGDFTLRSKGSGSIDLHNINGSVHAPNR